MFLVIANWKMNGNAALVAQFNASLSLGNANVVICPPFHLISAVNGNKGAQNCHHSTNGAYTGEVSAQMLAEIGATYVILGHSERRQAGETCEVVAKKIIAAQNANLHVILCVGENEGENAEQIIAKQLEVLPANKNGITIAYEPVWAIGTGRTPNNADIEKAHKFIAQKTGLDVIYGGSVNENNAAQIRQVAGVAGFLVGGASLDITKFNKIIEVV